MYNSILWRAVTNEKTTVCPYPLSVSSPSKFSRKRNLCSSLVVSQVVLMLSSLSITGSDFPQKIPLEAAWSVPLVVPVTALASYR